MISSDTFSWLTNSTDALFVVTAALALFFRYRALADRPKGKDGDRPSWGGEMTAAEPGGARGAAARGAQVALWYKLVLVSLGMAALANIAGALAA